MVQPKLKIEQMPTDELVLYAGNAKQHPDKQVREIANSIEQFGFSDPVGVWTRPDGLLEIVEGHGRVMAAKRLGIEKVPVIRLDHLDGDARRAYAHVHNQTTLTSGFDMDALTLDLASIPGFDWEDFGFDWQDYSEDDFGVGFELPDGDAPQCRSMTLRLTQEQFEAVEAAVEAVGETTMEGGSETGRKVAEVCRQWAGL